jgi:hypothetical protein
MFNVDFRKDIDEEEQGMLAVLCLFALETIGKMISEFEDEESYSPDFLKGMKEQLEEFRGVLAEQGIYKQ